MNRERGMNLEKTNVSVPAVAGPPATDIGTLIRRINDDLQGIAKDEIAIARIEVTRAVKRATAEAGAVLLGGLVALIGIAMLFVAAVPALAPVIEPLWLRLVLVALAYMVVGSAVAATFVKRLKHDAKPDLGAVTREAKQTIHAVREGLHHG